MADTRKALVLKSADPNDTSREALDDALAGCILKVPDA